MPASAQSYQQLSRLDERVLELATAFDLVVTRTTDSFVSYDGAGVLNVSPNSELDGDDSLAQIVLHELAHHWVEGVESHAHSDWGLSNFDDGHLDREYAALRLQLAILAPHQLQRLLHPTTVHRWFYQALLDVDAADAEISPASIETFASSKNAETASVQELRRAVHRSSELYHSGVSNLTADPRRELVTDLLRDIASTCLPNSG